MDSYGETPLTITVEELSDRLMQAFVVWLLYGRGPEGMTMPEMEAAVRRLPPPRWLAMFVENQPLGLSALKLDPETFFDGTREIPDDEVFRLDEESWQQPPPWTNDDDDDGA